MERFITTGYVSPHRVGYRMLQYENHLRTKEILKDLALQFMFTASTYRHRRELVEFEKQIHVLSTFNISTQLLITRDAAYVIVTNLDYINQ